MNSYGYVGDVFVVVEIGASGIIESPRSIVDVYSSQYAADEVAAKANARFKRVNLPNRYAVICRSLYE